VILYVNGDSNSVGAELNDHSKSWPQLLSKKLNYELCSDAKGGASNPYILRTTWRYLSQTKPDFVIIGWTGWEREEWLHNGTYVQVNASGHSPVPDDLVDRYKQWVIDQTEKTHADKSKKLHEEIFKLHQHLVEQHIPHLFFNALMSFQHETSVDPQHWFNWENCYLGPYDNNLSYYWHLKNQGFVPTSNNHHLEPAQIYWADLLYKIIFKTHLL